MNLTEQEEFWRGDFGDNYVDRNSKLVKIIHF